MRRVLWGEFEDDEEAKGPIKPDEIILPSQKADKLQNLKEALKETERKVAELSMMNPIVTQTVEVMNQTEMLQTLIDTYSNKSGSSNYLHNPSQMVPQVDFPPENSANIINEERFTKPLWFIPPIETDFSRGIPCEYPPITNEIAKAAIRKAIAGLGRIAGFTEASDNALILFTDSVEEYVRNLLQTMKHVQAIDMKDKSNILDIEIMEKAYQSITHSSLLCLHDYYKNEIIGRNLAGIAEFKEVYNEYDKLRKESQNMQKPEFKEEDISFLDIPGMLQAGGSSQTREGLNPMQIVDGDGGVSSGVLDYFENNDMAEASTVEEQSAGGSSYE